MPEAGNGSEGGGITAVTMPKWGLAMEEGTVTEWLLPEGASVAAGADLVEIETSKITNVLEAPAAGVLRRIVAAPGAVLPIGALLAVLAGAETAEAEIDAFVAGFTVAAAEEGEAGAAAPAPLRLDTPHGALSLTLAGPEDAAPVLLVHGFGGGADNWMFVQPLLAERFRTAALDLPGHGGSFKTLPPGYDATEAVATAVAHLGGRVHLVGHSLGGALALRHAAAHGDTVASLTLVAPAGLGEEINAGYVQGFLDAGRRKQMKAVLGLLLHDPEQVSRDMVENVLRLKRIDGVQDSLAAMADAAFDGGRQRLDLRDVLAGLPCPAAIVWGADDRVIPAAHAAGLPQQVAVTVLEETGHLPHLEKAAATAAAIAACIDAA